MATKKVEIYEHTCQHCAHIWRSDRERPSVCPSCKSYNWDREPRKYRRVSKDK